MKGLAYSGLLGCSYHISTCGTHGQGTSQYNVEARELLLGFYMGLHKFKTDCFFMSIFSRCSKF